MKNFETKTLVIVLILLGAIIGGGIAPLAKITLTQISPELFTFLRFFIASIVLIPFFLQQKSKIRKRLFRLVPLSLFQAGNVLFFAYGVRFTTADVSQALYVLSPIFVLILSHFLLSEKLNLRKITGVFIGFLGAFVVVFLPLIEGSKFSGNINGNLIILAAVLLFSIYTVLSKKAQKEFSPMELTLVMCITISVVSFGLMIPDLSTSVKEIQAMSQAAIVGIIYISVLATAILYFIFQQVIKLSTATVSSTVLFIQPISTIIWSYLLLSEMLTLGFVIGGLLTLVGTFIVVRASSGKIPRIDAAEEF